MNEFSQCLLFSGHGMLYLQMHMCVCVYVYISALSICLGQGLECEYPEKWLIPWRLPSICLIRFLCSFICGLFLKKLFVWQCQVLVVACRIFRCGMWDLVSWPAIEPWPPALGVWCLSHWSTRDIPVICGLNGQGILAIECVFYDSCIPASLVARW